MNPVTSYRLLACCLITVGLVSSSPEPVLINPAPSPPIHSAQDSFVTQTVYGFLDFTTTIGNTVMIFSPQSAASGVKETTPQPPVKVVIDTKPVTQTVKETVIEIKPSKTLPKSEKKAVETNKNVISVVQVQSKKQTIKPSKIEIKPSPISKVNVIEGKSSVVNVAPVISSNVQVVSTSVNKVPNKPPNQNVITKVEVITSKANPQPIVSSRVEVHDDRSSNVATAQPSIVSSVVEIQTDDEPAVIIGNNIGEPEYDFLSRQPSEVVEETYKVINLKPSSKFRLKPRPSIEAKSKASAKRADPFQPIGFVTKLGGTVVKDGATTVHETSVIGTIISGKYAQVLQSTSQVYKNHHHHQKAKINPSPTLRILKTAAPSLGKSKHNRHLEPTPADSVNEEAINNGKSTRKPVNGGALKRFKNKQREQEIEQNDTQQLDHQQNNKKNSRSRPTQPSRKQHTSHRNQKYGRGSSKIATVSVSSEQTTPAAPTTAAGKRYNARRNKQRASTTVAPEAGSFTRRSYRPKVQASTVESNAAGTSLYKFTLNRLPGRWQYKTTAKPRISIRKQAEDEQNETTGATPNSQQDVSGSVGNDVVTPQAKFDDGEGLVGSESVASIIDDESSTENKLDTPFPLETIKVEISTPPDFKDIYYEIATIKSPYTFKIGSVKNTRYVTVTSTFEKVLEKTENTIVPTMTEPLTENILATSSNYGKDNNFLDSSIATLPPLYLASDMETPPLETVTETFSTTQTMLKTHILPVVKGGNDTTSYTLVQTYLVSRLVTATKTLPPMEAYHFIPSKTLNEFNSHLDEAGSELHLELEFGDDNDHDDDRHIKRDFPPDLDLANIGSDFDLSDVDRTKLENHMRSKKATTPKPHIPDPIPTPGLSPEQLQQLAFLRLLNPAAAGLNQGQIITTSKPVFKLQTVYDTHVIPIVNGGNTILSTISKSVGMITKTEYEYGTSQLPSIPLPPVNPIFGQQPQQQFAVTSSPVIQNTVVTETNSKVLKLTFGAKTAYTTIFSTKVVPTVLTTYMTASVPVQQPAGAFPGYFPAPYPPYPYVG